LSYDPTAPPRRYWVMNEPDEMLEYLDQGSYDEAMRELGLVPSVDLDI